MTKKYSESPFKQSKKHKKKTCIDRDSNPSLGVGNA